MAFLLNGKADLSMDYFEDTLFNVRGFFIQSLLSAGLTYDHDVMLKKRGTNKMLIFKIYLSQI